MQCWKCAFRNNKLLLLSLLEGIYILRVAANTLYSTAVQMRIPLYRDRLKISLTY